MLHHGVEEPKLKPIGLEARRYLNERVFPLLHRRARRQHTMQVTGEEVTKIVQQDWFRKCWHRAASMTRNMQHPVETKIAPLETLQRRYIRGRYVRPSYYILHVNMAGDARTRDHLQRSTITLKHVCEHTCAAPPTSAGHLDVSTQASRHTSPSHPP